MTSLVTWMPGDLVAPSKNRTSDSDLARPNLGGIPCLGWEMFEWGWEALIQRLSVRTADAISLRQDFIEGAINNAHHAQLQRLGRVSA